MRRIAEQSRSILLYLLFIFPAVPLSLSAQEGESAEESSPVTFHGSATLGGDFYSYSAPEDFTPRYPGSLLRLVFRAELEVGDIFSLPINIMVSSDETGVVTPLTGSPSVGQFLQNQMNTISIAPRIGWAQFFLGSHVPEQTGMAFDGSQIFGGGIGVRPGKFRLSASAGVSQRGVEVDTARGIRGAFLQKAFAGRIGYGDEGGEEVGFALSFGRIQDDTNSIRSLTTVHMLEIPDTGSFSKTIPIIERHELMPTPVEGNSASARLYIPIIPGLSVSGEAALSNYTRDMSAEPIDEEIPLLEDIMTQRIGSRLDYALNASLAFNRPTFGVTAKAAYLGPGFVTLGNPYTQSDRKEFTLNPRVSLLGHRLNISGSIGHRTNNLSGTLADRTTQIIGGANVTAQITESLSLDAGYNNMGISSNNRTDTFRLNNNTESLTFSPTYVLAGGSAPHILAVQFGLDRYRDNNAVFGTGNDVSTRTIGGYYSLAMTSLPLSGTLAANTTEQSMANGELTINSLSLGIGYRLLNNRLQPSLSASASQSTLSENEPQTRVSFRIGTRWEILENLHLDLSASTDLNTYRGGTAEHSVTENFIRTSVTKGF